MNSPQPDSLQAQVQQMGVVFLTVHGTWAGAARWAQPVSVLGRALVESARERGETAVVVPFSWSGKNSVAARREAGAGLARRLLELRREDPSRAIYVVAHSHGGSVFAYAMKEEPGLADHINGFIALATPWIAVQPCGYALALRTLLFSAVLYLLLLPSLVGAGRVSAWGVDYLSVLRESRRAPLPEDDVGARFGQALGDFAEDIGNYAELYLLAGLAAGIAWYLLHGRLTRWLGDSAAEFEKRTKVAADRASTIHERLPPSVFFKPIGDEAALALTWTSGMASLMQAASQLLFYFLQFVRDSWLSTPRLGRIIGGVTSIVAWSVGSAIIAVFTFLADGATTSAKLATAVRDRFAFGFPQGHFDIAYFVLDLPSVFAVVVWAGLIVALAALVAVTLVAWLAAAGAGIPTLRAALFMRILVEAAPLGDQKLVLVDVSAPQRQERVAATALGHSSLYESPGVITAVLEAIHRFQSVTNRESITS